MFSGVDEFTLDDCMWYTRCDWCSRDKINGLAPVYGASDGQREKPPGHS